MCVCVYRQCDPYSYILYCTLYMCIIRCACVCLLFLSAAQLCSKALESLACSRAVRAEIRSLLVSVQTRKQETHVKITTAISQSVRQATEHRVSSCTHDAVLAYNTDNPAMHYIAQCLDNIQ